jgi:hypothetical protein
MTALESVSVAHAVRTCERRAEVISLAFAQREARANLLDNSFEDRIFTPSVTHLLKGGTKCPNPWLLWHWDCFVIFLLGVCYRGRKSSW